MIRPDELVVLDTNVLVHAVRETSVWREIEKQLQLRARPERPVISVVTVGEMKALARKLGWGEARIARLDELLRELVIVDIRTSTKLLDRYAELDAESEKNGQKMGKNDLWIAATTILTGGILITTDRDFDHLHPRWLRRWRIDPHTLDIFPEDSGSREIHEEGV